MNDQELKYFTRALVHVLRNNMNCIAVVHRALKSLSGDEPLVVDQVLSLKKSTDGLGSMVECLDKAPRMSAKGVLTAFFSGAAPFTEADAWGLAELEQLLTLYKTDKSTERRELIAGGLGVYTLTNPSPELFIADTTRIRGEFLEVFCEVLSSNSVFVPFLAHAANKEGVLLTASIGREKIELKAVPKQ